MRPLHALRKLILKATPPGARWITVHPHGEDSKGQPVLVQPEKNGVYRVIGGAGGSLNYLKLRGVKSEKHYKEEAKRKAAERRQAKKLLRERDKETGVAEGKKKQRQAVKDQLSDAQTRFVQTVAQTMGWGDDVLEPKLPADLSDKARRQAERKHQRHVLQQAKEAVDSSRRQLIEEAAARGVSELGEIPLESTDPEVVSVADLAPTQTQGHLGYATQYGKRAAEHGLTDEEREEEAGAAAPERSHEQQERREARKIEAESIKKELAAIKEPAPPPPKTLDAQKTIELMKAQKELGAVQSAARKANKQIDSDTEEKAYVLATSSGDDIDKQVKQQIEQDLLTARTRAFLDEVRTVGGEDFETSLWGHIGAGAYDAVNALSLAATGQALVDRDVVDVLGVAGAAQVVANRLHDLGDDEVERIRGAVEAFHRDRHAELSKKALDEAKTYLDQAAKLAPPDAHDGFDLAAAQEINAKRREAAQRAQDILGTALGEMEANASLVVALGQQKKDQLDVPLAKLSAADAITRARAIGLKRGDYEVSRAGDSTMLTVNASGIDRLAQAIDPHEIQATRAAQAIVDGRADEDDYLPGGIARRADLSMHTPEGAAPSLAQPFEPKGDMAQSVRDYIGGRTADGDAPADIVADLLSQDLVERTGERRDEYFKALDAIVPLRDKDGKQLRAEAHQADFEHYADAFVDSRYGAERSPLHRQKFAVGDTAVESLHRALAEHPGGIAAYKPVGDLTPQDQRALRDHFSKHVARHDEAAHALRADLQELTAAEPEREVDDMFGRGTNPEWVAWKERVDDTRAALRDKELSWPQYVQVMGGTANAYAAMQDRVRSDVNDTFAHTYNKLQPDAPLKIGRTVIRNNLAHLDAVDAEAREQRLSEHRDLIDRLRNRVEGRYAHGSVHDKLAATREAMAAAEQSQMGFFGAEHDVGERPLQPDERHYLGHAAERQIAAMMPIVGRNFDPSQPTKIWQPSMNGRFINQQRAVKLIGHSKRLFLAQGTGSGKTVVQLAGFTDAKSRGEAKRAVFIVPSIVQGQFGGAALRFLDPGKYKWHATPGASHAERVAAYKDPETDFSVVTHQALRDDLLKLSAAHEGVKVGEMRQRVAKMSDSERREWMQGTLEREGINWDYVAVDEGHDLLDRAGKKDSSLSNVVGAVSDLSKFYVAASADPVKNDPSEIYSLLHRIAPQTFTDRAQFMRRYGANTRASKDSLHRLMARYIYPGRIESGKRAQRKTLDVALTDGQRKAVEGIDHAAAAMRLARMRGTVDVEAAKRLSPESFAKAPADSHEAIAKALTRNIGIIKDMATRKAIDEYDGGAKLDRLSKAVTERAGKPGVVFAHSREAVRQIEKRLRDEGHRVVTITGSDSAKSKYAKRQKFRPETGEPEADILVCSDAGAVGLNAQRGQWLAQYDTPVTAKVHAQRNGRIDRLGQKNDVELLDLVADHPYERRARRRLAQKYELRDIMTSPLEGLDDTGVAGYLNRADSAREQRGLF